MIQCPNYSCQAINAEAHRFCHQCQAPVPRRFLWAVGHRAEEFSPGTVIADRYLCKARQVFLDLKPGLPPGTLSEIPFSILPYLRLTPYRLNLPQVYGWADGSLESGDMTRLMFLENAALSKSLTEPDVQFPVLPSLSEAWSSGAAFQQLHWLWQIAQLWHPLAAEHIASTLLEPELIRVEASLIRILQLHTPQPNGETPQPRLQQLGKWWQRLLPKAQSEIQPFLDQLCQKLLEGYFQDGQALLTALDLGLQAVGRSHAIDIGIATQTDKGPSRANNQDACFPASGSVAHTTVTPGVMDSKHTSLIVVCDGIGGHQGGEIASATAIEEISHTLQALAPPTSSSGVNPWMVHDHLNGAIAQANDAINQRNDEEKRRERARMGTTVVMGLLYDYECYLSHVGDSRVYWITPSGCHQITLDDDVASREARLGYGTYRSVLYHPNAGALVQALGMGPSKNLYPSGQRIILGEEGLLLFCSDGLSDQDLIETCWESIVLPLFQSPDQKNADLTLGRVSQALIDLANTRNGHDNVTIGLVKWRSRQTETIQIPTLDTLISTYNHDLAERSPSTDLADKGKPSPGKRSLSDLLEPIGVAEDVEDEGKQRTAFAEVDNATSLSDSAPNPSVTQTNHESSETPDASSPEDNANRLNNPFGDDVSWISPSTSSQPSRRSALFVIMMTIVSLLGLLVLTGGIAYFAIPGVSDRINGALGINSNSNGSNPPTPSPHSPTPDRSNPNVAEDGPSSSTSVGVSDMNDSLVIGHILNLRRTAPNTRTLSASDDDNQDGIADTELLMLFTQPPNAVSSKPEPQLSNNSDSEQRSRDDINAMGVIPWGSILQVQKTLPISSSSLGPPSPLANTGVPPDGSQPNNSSQTNKPPSDPVEPENIPESSNKPESERWVQVQLCFSPPESGVAIDSVSNKILPVGSIGWISERQLKELSYLDRGQASPFNEYCSLRP